MTQRAYAFRAGDRWIEIIGAWASMLGDHHAGWVDTATPAERQAAGAVEIQDGQLVPHAWQIKLGEELVDKAGVPTRQGVFADLTLDERRHEMIAQLRTLWHVHEVSGFVGPAGHVATDETVQRRLLVALAQLDLPHADETIAWEIRPGQIVATSPSQLRLLAAAVFQHVGQCAQHARLKLQQLNAAQDHAQLSAIDLTQGWPP